MDALISLIVIVTILSIGCYLGKNTPKGLKDIAISLISPTVFVLLFLMGFNCGLIFFDGSFEYSSMFEAFVLAGTISFFTFIGLANFSEKAEENTKEKRGIWGAFSGCAKVVFSFCVGVFVCYIIGSEIKGIKLAIDLVLYFLIFLIGFDLSSFSLKGIDFDHIKTSFVALLSTFLGALLFFVFCKRSITEVMIASSGFGWFTLSGPMVTASKGAELGMFAFLVDLFRELISIVFLYLLGSRHSKSAVGISGAAALDSALPFIKENCEDKYINHAIASGFILTVLAPVFISFFCSL